MATGREQLREAFRNLFLVQGATPERAAKLADLAADLAPQKPTGTTTAEVKPTEAKRGKEKPVNGPGWERGSFDIEITERQNLGRVLGRVR